MKKRVILYMVFMSGIVHGQGVKDKLALAIQQMENEPSLSHAIIGMSVTDSKTGRLLYEHNAQTGLAPASTQKLFTSCAAFDILGKNYKYSTTITYKNCKPAPSRSYFVIKPSGDPTFGSPRFEATKSVTVLKNIIAAINQKNITPVSSQFVVIDSAFENNSIPGGWIWEDIGNYYGASAQSLNWMENAYDIVLASGRRVGDKAAIVKTKPAGLSDGMQVAVKSAEKGSGDNSTVYIGTGSLPALIDGTIPANEDSFSVGASIPDPKDVFIQQLNNNLKAEKATLVYGLENRAPMLALPDSIFDFIDLYKHVSPPLDTINYWFLKKSINLYGEALIKTMALEKSGYASTQKGVALLKDYWEQNGIEPSALHICDGSGLSPQNRVTADALVKALQYAKTRPWFSSFYYDLPEHNGMKMKSGSIGGARAYAGYHTAKDGNAYSFAIIVNNYDGAAADTVKKIFSLLDILK